MQEIWYNAKIKYINIKKNPPSYEVCQCAIDIENNGIFKMLRFIALQIREPDLMYGNHITINNKTFFWENNVYSYTYSNFPQKQEAADNVLLEPKDAMPPLTNESAWSTWKKLMMDNMSESDDYDLALYLYCALNNN